MADDDLRLRFLAACTRRSNAVNERNRALLNIEIAERNALTAEAKVAAAEADIDKLLDQRPVPA